MSEMKPTFSELFKEARDLPDEPCWGGYPKEAFKKASRALVVRGKDDGITVLYTGGPYVRMEMEEQGLAGVDMFASPDGIWVWEGKLKTWRTYCGDYDSELVGEYRPPTPQEWEAIHKNENPWDESEWGLIEPPEEKADAEDQEDHT